MELQRGVVGDVATFPALRDAGVQAGVADGLNSALAFLKRSPTALVFSRPALPGYRRVP